MLFSVVEHADVTSSTTLTLKRCLEQCLHGGLCKKKTKVGSMVSHSAK